MSREHEDDLLRRLAAEAPDAHEAEPPGERERVWSRIGAAAQPSARAARHGRRRLVLALTAGVVVAGFLAVILFGSSESGPGPARALAIERGPEGVTLTSADADASADEMNRELEAAGIDRVRVISVPGSPNHAGTWGGMINLVSSCEGGTRKVGFGVQIAYHPDNGVPAPGRDVVDLQLPRSDEVAADLGLQRGAGKRAIVSTDSIGDPDYAPTILIAIHPRSGDEPASAKELTPGDLVRMGGVFAPFGRAMADGPASCGDLGLKPLPPPTFPPPGDWVTIRITDTAAGAKRMTQELSDAGIQGGFRLLPAQPEEVGRWMGFKRVPPFPPDARPVGNVFDILTGNPARPEKPSGKVLALRREAFTAFPDAHWVFYVGRHAQPGERPLVMTFDGPRDAEAALGDFCKGASRVSEPNGHKWCASVLPAQVPRP